MDLSKYPLDKIFYYVAGIVPGFAALLIFDLATPGSFGWFFSLAPLGYNTKLSIVIVVAFVIGNSMTSFLSALLGAFGGALSGYRSTRPFQPSYTVAVAPWRNQQWRAVLKNHLRAAAPNDTLLIGEDLLKTRIEIVNLQPEPARARALAELHHEKLMTEINDGNWFQWYDHYHNVVLFDTDKSFHYLVHWSFALNLGAAGLYVLFSMIFVPSLRVWWCIWPSIMWVLIFASHEYSSFKKVTNYWSTLSLQIKYLLVQGPV